MSDQAVRSILAGTEALLARNASRGGNRRSRWGDNLLTTDREHARAIASTAASPMRFGNLMLGEVASREMLAADVAGTAGARRGAYAGIAPPPRRRFRVLELLAQATTDGNQVPFTIESGSDTAAETAEGAAGPEDGATYVDGTAPVRTITTWRRTPREVLADVATLRASIDRRVRFAVLKRLEQQVIGGDGSGDNLTGILHTAGIGTVSSGATPYVRVMAGVEAVAAAGADPTAIVCAWADVDAIAAAAAADSATLETERVPLIPSVTMPAGTAIVGAWDQAAELVIRAGVSVLASDMDGDNFITGRVTLKALTRAALPVWQPTGFCAVTLA